MTAPRWTPNVAVVGLGKIGLPLAAVYAANGASVIGCDVDEGVVGAVNAGECPILGEPGLEGAVRQGIRRGLLRASTNTASAVSESEIVVVVVPVGIDADNRTDFASLDAAARDIGSGLKAGALVVLETTVPVGTSRGRFGRALEDASGLALGDFDLAYSPERVSSGQIFRDLGAYPKVIGGVTDHGAGRASEFYTRILRAEVMVLPDAETAEFTKLAESIYRDVNIALANDLARAADALGVDFAVAAAAANSQPFSHLHAPGVGVGGHCIPVYPYFLLQTSPDQELVRHSRAVNDSMARYAVSKLDQAFADDDTSLMGKTVLVLGLAYRGGIKEAGWSSTLLLASSLRERGARVLVHDPLYTDAEMRTYGLEPSSLPAAESIDACILQAAHPEYASLDFTLLRGCRVLLDGRSALARAAVEAAGMRYIAVGDGRQPEP